MIDLTCVVTTISPPTASMRDLASRLPPGTPLLIVGDRKGPGTYDVEGAQLLTLDHQKALPFRLAKLLPTDHYSRKNLGYLVAIARGSLCVYETDDDNAPLPEWKPRTLLATAELIDPEPWCNVYRLFSRENIWP